MENENEIQKMMGWWAIADGYCPRGTIVRGLLSGMLLA